MNTDEAQTVVGCAGIAVVALLLMRTASLSLGREHACPIGATDIVRAQVIVCTVSVRQTTTLFLFVIAGAERTMVNRARIAIFTVAVSQAGIELGKERAIVVVADPDCTRFPIVTIDVGGTAARRRLRLDLARVNLEIAGCGSTIVTVVTVLICRTAEAWERRADFRRVFRAQVLAILDVAHVACARIAVSASLRW